MTELRTIEGGWLDGHRIRRARKAGFCDYRFGGELGGCNCAIAVNDLYVEGEFSDAAPGFSRQRYCASCAAHGALGPEAKDAIAKAEPQS